MICSETSTRLLSLRFTPLQLPVQHLLLLSRSLIRLLHRLTLQLLPLRQQSLK